MNTPKSAARRDVKSYMIQGAERRQSKHINIIASSIIYPRERGRAQKEEGKEKKEKKKKNSLYTHTHT